MKLLWNVFFQDNQPSMKLEKNGRVFNVRNLAILMSGISGSRIGYAAEILTYGIA